MSYKGFFNLQYSICNSITNRQPENNEILKRINNTIKLARAKSNYYKRMDNINELESLSDICSLPFTTKEDIKSNYPFGFLACKLEEVIRYGESNGTSGDCSTGFVTAHDWIENTITLYLGWKQLLTNKDKLVIAVPYSLSFVAADMDRVAEIIGCMTIAVGVTTGSNSWRRVIKIMHEVQATSLICAPTRVIRLAKLASEMGYYTKSDFSLKKIVIVGEVLSPAKKKLIENLWGCSVYITYGMTEATSVGSPCKNNHLHLCENRYYFEVVNPITNLSVEDGEKGELVLTSLNNQAMPLIRYKTGDLVKVDRREDNCELMFKGIIHYGRVSDYILYQDKKLYFYDIENLILSVDSIEPFFKVVYDDKQKLTIGICTKRCSEFDGIKNMLMKKFFEEFNIYPNVISQNVSDIIIEIDNASKPGGVYFQKEVKA